MTAAARAALALVGALVAALAGCSAQPAQSSATAEDVRSASPVDLSLVGADGERFELAQLRGRPLLLFVFTTYDQPSQLAITPLASFVSAHASLQVIGIAAQPSPEALLPLYRDALALPFPLAYEREPTIVSGASALGAIETVPTYVLLDAHGRLAARRTGGLTSSQLEEFAAPVLR